VKKPGPREHNSTGQQPLSSYDRALALLARREYSVRELQSKLAARGHAASEATAAIDQLKEQHYQDDARFGASVARRRMEQGYGAQRIWTELKSHGLDAAAIRAVLDELDADWSALARAQLRRRYGTCAATDHKEQSARAAFLLRRGFDPATVRIVARAEADEAESDE
jgi:regulatory protein